MSELLVNEIEADVLGYVCRVPRDDPPGCNSQHGVVVALDVRGPTRAKVLDAAFVADVSSTVQNVRYIQRLSEDALGLVMVVEVVAHGLDVLTGTQTAIEILKASRSNELWAHIRTADPDTSVRIRRFELDEMSFYELADGFDDVPAKPGVYVVVDEVAGVSTALGVHEASDLRSEIANDSALEPYKDRIFGSPTVYMHVVSSPATIHRTHGRQRVAQLLLGTGRHLDPDNFE